MPTLTRLPTQPLPRLIPAVHSVPNQATTLQGYRTTTGHTTCAGYKGTTPGVRVWLFGTYLQLSPTKAHKDVILGASASRAWLLLCKLPRLLQGYPLHGIHAVVRLGSVFEYPRHSCPSLVSASTPRIMGRD